MLEKKREPEVNTDDPWSDDKLGRSETAQQLTRILETVDGPLVTSVYAPFGMGKTFFAQRWATDLRRQGKTVIYFNAWETDFAENPIIAFMEALRSEFKKLRLPDSKSVKVSKKIEEVIRIGAPALVKTAAKAAARAGGYVLVGDKVDDLTEAALKGAVDEVEKFATAQIDAFAAERQARSDFKVELEKLRQTIFESSNDDVQESLDQKIYIIVDELDRCRPFYALDFLEAVKHLFDVPGFIFVLCLDQDQINEFAAHLYGSRKSGETYLTKFFHWEFHLPDPDLSQFAKFAIGQVVSEFKFQDGRFSDGFAKYVSEFCTRKRFSLRMIERVAIQTELAVRSLGGRWLELAVPMAAAIVARLDDNERYKRLIAHRIQANELRDYFQVKESEKFIYSWLVLFAADLHNATSGSDKKELQASVQQIRERLDWDYDIDERRLLGMVVSEAIDANWKITG